VVFHVGSTGVPSQARIKTSSGSPELDSAALACVMKLRYLPATAAGEGGAIESWQQMAWRGVTHAAAAPAASAASAAPAGGASVAAPAAGVAAATLGVAAAGASAATATTHAAPAVIGSSGAEVRSCADAQGKLTQDPVISRTSGDAAFDAAALAIARSGSGHYRPGCSLLSIRPSGP
jgi:TonB family protein